MLTNYQNVLTAYRKIVYETCIKVQKWIISMKTTCFMNLNQQNINNLKVLKL